jgi:hypothetical protein
VSNILDANIMARLSIWELTIVCHGAFLGLSVAGISLAVSCSEIGWASEVEWLSSFESTTFEWSLTNTSVTEGSTKAPSASDALVLSNTAMAITKVVTSIS